MKVSLYRLSEFIDIEDYFQKPEELANILSLAGFEVEEWEDHYSCFDNVLIGQVKQKQRHPNADRLWFCQVQITSSGDTTPIVCGADNFHEGDKVAVALPRKLENLPPLKGEGLKDTIKIQVKKIRGQISQGMLLAFHELFPNKIKDTNTEKGIMVLSKNAKIGDLFAPTYMLNDIIFKLNITPNRADCLSHLGLARELACLLGRKLNTLVRPSQDIKYSKQKSDNILDVHVKVPKLCPRYTGAILYDVQVKPSPLWLQIGLRHLDLKPINNIVDLTNYLMIQRGQPLHAFDLDVLCKSNSKKHMLTVELARKGEKFKSLDEQDLELNGTELCIRNANGTVALAGIIGGLHSAIHLETKNIFIESACFDAITLQKTGKKFHIETDSMYRFSRNSVPAVFCKDVLQEALYHIQALSGGKPAKKEYDIWTHKTKKNIIHICQEDIEKRLGQKIIFKKFCEWMKRLFCELTPTKPTAVAVTVPDFRQMDLSIKEDLIEEYARLEGYDKIPEHIYPISVPSMQSKDYIKESHIINILNKEGFFEVINHDFISKQFSDEFLQSSFSPIHLKETHLKNYQPVLLNNPLSAEYNMMRTSLLPSLFKNALHSLHHGSVVGRLFELGSVFLKASSSASSPTNNPYKEIRNLGWIAWGQKESLWENGNKNRECVYDLKGAMQTTLERLKIYDFQWEQQTSTSEFIHPGQYVVLKIQGKPAGFAGSLHPTYADKYKLRCNMAIAEWNNILDYPIGTDRSIFQPISRFPQIERDLAFWIPETVSAGDILQDLKKIAGPLCHSIKIFDIYKSDKKSERSIAFRLNWQAKEKTLTDKDIAHKQDKITKTLIQKWKLRLR